MRLKKRHKRSADSPWKYYLMHKINISNMFIYLMNESVCPGIYRIIQYFDVKNNFEASFHIFVFGISSSTVLQFEKYRNNRVISGLLNNWITSDIFMLISC